MLRLALLALIVVCPAFAVKAEQAQPKKPVPITKAALDIERLKNWGTKKYLYQVERGGERTTLGIVTMSTEVGENRVKLKDNWELNWRGKKIKLILKMDCRRDGLLRPTMIQSNGEGDDEVGTFSAEVGPDKATVTAENGKTRKIEFPADTLTDVAMFRIFTLLPRSEGTVFAVGHVLEVSELNLKGPATIGYRGLDTITVDGKPLELHKFVYIREGRTVEEAWVDSDHILRQVRIDGRKILTIQPE